MYMSTHTCTCPHTHVHVYTRMLHVHTHMYTSKHALLHVYTQTAKCLDTHATCIHNHVHVCTHIDRKKPPSPGGFSIYYVPWSRAVCKRFHDEMRPSNLVVKSLTHGSWSGNIVIRKPPQRGGGVRTCTWMPPLLLCTHTCYMSTHTCMCNKSYCNVTCDTNVTHVACIYVYKYTHLYTYINIHMYTRIYIYNLLHTHVTCMYINIHIYICIYTHNLLHTHVTCSFRHVISHTTCLVCATRVATPVLCVQHVLRIAHLSLCNEQYHCVHVLRTDIVIIKQQTISLRTCVAYRLYAWLAYSKKMLYVQDMWMHTARKATLEYWGCRTRQPGRNWLIGPGAVLVLTQNNT